jgi:hypothetical protein
MLPESMIVPCHFWVVFYCMTLVFLLLSCFGLVREGWLCKSVHVYRQEFSLLLGQYVGTKVHIKFKEIAKPFDKAGGSSPALAHAILMYLLVSPWL